MMEFFKKLFLPRSALKLPVVAATNPDANGTAPPATGFLALTGPGDAPQIIKDKPQDTEERAKRAKTRRKRWGRGSDWVIKIVGLILTIATFSCGVVYTVRNSAISSLDTQRNDWNSLVTYYNYCRGLPDVSSSNPLLQGFATASNDFRRKETRTA
jgi:hypothetical protein